MTPATRMKASRKKARRAGYTLIEVMMAIAIITASSVALIGLQEIVVRGNMDARQTSTATNIARTTIGLLRVDAVNWSSATTSATVTLGPNARGFLRDAPVAATAAGGPWGPFGATVNAPEHAYDYQGRPTIVAANMFYCVETRYAWIYQGSLLRVDLRVWWVRPSSVVNAAIYAGCPTQPLVLNTADLHSLQATTTLRYTPPPVP